MAHVSCRAEEIYSWSNLFEVRKVCITALGERDDQHK